MTVEAQAPHGGMASGADENTKAQSAYPASVLVATGIGTLSLGIVFYAAEVHHATPTQIGCLAATWSLHYVLGCAAFRAHGAPARPQRQLVAATATMGLMVWLVLACRQLAWVYVCYALYGLATSRFWPPLMGWLSAGLEGERLNRTMGRFNLCWSAGGIVGPGLAGLLARYDPRWPIGLAGGLYLVTAAHLLREAGRQPAGAGSTAAPALPPTGAPRSAETPAPAAADASTPLRYPAWVSLVAAYVVTGIVLSVFPLAAQRQLGLGKPAVGLLLFVRALATSVTLGGLGRTTVWHYRARPMAVGLLAFAGMMLVLPQARTLPALVVLLAGLGVLLAQAYANSLFHGVAGSRHRAARMAVHEALLSVGLVCGSACGGALYQAAGYAAVCRATAGLLVVAAGLVAALARRR